MRSADPSGVLVKGSGATPHHRPQLGTNLAEMGQAARVRGDEEAVPRVSVCVNIASAHNTTPVTSAATRDSRATGGMRDFDGVMGQTVRVGRLRMHPM